MVSLFSYNFDDFLPLFLQLLATLQLLSHSIPRRPCSHQSTTFALLYSGSDMIMGYEYVVDTVTANVMLEHPIDARSYEAACLILKDLDILNVRLLTNNPEKVASLESGGIRINERIPMAPRHWEFEGNPDASLELLQNAELDKYMKTKIGRMKHKL